MPLRTCHIARERRPGSQNLRGYSRTALWLGLLALFSCSLLFYGIRVTHQALVELAGIVVTVAFVGLALVAARNGRRSERARAQVDERFRVLFEQSSDAHLLLDDGGIIDCNDAAIRMLHCRDKAAVLALHPAMLSPEFQPDGRRSLEKCVEMDALARQNGYHRFDWMHLKVDGEVFPVEVTLTPVKLSGKDSILIVWHDLTERREVEEALRANEERLREAQHIAHIGSWERNLITGQMLWSDEMYRIYRFDPAEGMPTFDRIRSRIHPDDWEMYERILEAVPGHDGHYEYDMRLIFEDGAVTWGRKVTNIERDETGRVVRRFGTFMDVTAQKQTEQEQTKFVSLIENSSDFIAMASLDGALLTINPAGRKLVGLEQTADLTTAALPDFMPAGVWEWMQQGVLPIVMREDRWEGECQLVNVATGTGHDMQASFFLIRDPVSGEPMCLATVQRDITAAKWLDAQLQQNVILVQEQNAALEFQRQKLEAANAYLASLATTDGLTGAQNHRAFQERLAEEFRRTERTHCTFAVILLDVDRFKQYNDSFGHPEGDRVLKQVVQALHATARETDFVARYGGEEFILLLPETGVEGAMEAAERFRAAIEAQDWPLRQVTASFGVATLNIMTANGQQLVDLADRALYASKKAGRNCVTHADTVPVR